MMEMKNIQIPVLLLEHRRLFREALKSLLTGSQFAVDAQRDSLDINVGNHSEGIPPALIIYGAKDSEADMINDIEALHQIFKATRIVVIAHELSAQALAKAMKAGADAYLTGDLSREALIQSLQLVMLGEKVFPSPLAKVLIEGSSRDFPNDGRMSRDDFSERELQILRCLANGDPNKVIAARLDITEATVKVHLKVLLRKINVSNRTQAAIWAVAHGINDVPPATEVTE